MPDQGSRGILEGRQRGGVAWRSARGRQTRTESLMPTSRNHYGGGVMISKSDQAQHCVE